MSELVLAVDLGTTAMKVGLFTHDGARVAHAACPYPTHRQASGFAEQSSQDWWAALRTCLTQLSRVGDLRCVVAIGVVSQVNTHVCVDAAQDALGAAIVWSDQRAEIQAGELSTHPQRSAVLGDVKPDASHLLARARWWSQHTQDTWRRTRWILLPKDYLVLRLTDRAATDPISSIGLVDADGQYFTGMDELVGGVTARLPSLRSPDEVVGKICPEVAADLGFAEGTVVVAGTLDGYASALGSGLDGAGAAMDVGGTSEVVGVLSRRPAAPAGAVAFPWHDGLSLHAGPTQAGGDALRWWSNAAGTSVEDTLQRASTARPGSGGVVFLPHLAGQRAPLWDASLRGAFLGVSLDTGGAELARAVLEGVAYSARQLLDVLGDAAGVPLTGVMCSGAGSRSDVWCQIKADVLGLPVRRLTLADSGELGAALLAGVAAGWYPATAAMVSAVKVEREFEPRPTATERYAKLYELYEGSTAGLRWFTDGLAAWRLELPPEPGETKA